MKANVITSTIKLTPKMAMDFLSNNNANRHVDERLVLKYSNDIINGNWQMNGETIKIAHDGTVLDGQHRLKAVVKSAMPIDTLLVIGLERNAINTIDTGKPRSASNLFQINMISNSTNVASSISKYLGLCKGSKNVATVCKRDMRITNSDILNEYNLNPEFWQNTVRCGTVYYTKWFRIISPSDYSALYSFFRTKYDASFVDIFFDSIVERTGIGSLLFEKLMRDYNSKYKMAGNEKTALIIKAFNYYVSGNLPKVLKFSKEEYFPTI